MPATKQTKELSFVIPVLNEAHGLRALLGYLRQGFPAAQIIVVDGGSDDASVAEAIAEGVVVLTAQRGRGVQMNVGAAAAEGEFLCFLHADTKPDFDYAGLDKWLSTSFGWGFCRVALRSDRRSLRIVSACINLRSRWTGVATGDQMFVVRRSLFERLGGFAAIPLMEDVELSKRLRRETAPQPLPLRVSTSARRWEQGGVVSTVVRMWCLRLAFWLGVSPERLWAHYYGVLDERAEPLVDHH